MATLEKLQDAERLATPAHLRSNWRLQCYLFRGYYDAYVSVRHDAEQLCENRAKQALLADPSQPIEAAITAALPLFDSCKSVHLNPVARGWRQRAVELVGLINTTVGASVVQGQATDLNIGAIDTPLNDAVFFHTQLEALLNVSGGNSSALLAGVQRLLSFEDPGPGGFHDVLGPGFSSARSAHLVTEPGWASDPDYYRIPLATAEHLKGDPIETGVRLAWTGYAMSEYDTPLQLQYGGLEAAAEYQLSIVFHAAYPSASQMGDGRVVTEGGSPLQAVRLLANDQLLQDYTMPPSPMQVLSFPIKQATTQGGNLTISCNQRAGGGGTGRTCQIAEVWLRVAN